VGGDPITFVVLAVLAGGAPRFVLGVTPGILGEVVLIAAVVIVQLS